VALKWRVRGAVGLIQHLQIVLFRLQRALCCNPLYGIVMWWLAVGWKETRGSHHTFGKLVSHLGHTSVARVSLIPFCDIKVTQVWLCCNTKSVVRVRKWFGAVLRYKRWMHALTFSSSSKSLSTAFANKLGYSRNLRCWCLSPVAYEMISEKEQLSLSELSAVLTLQRTYQFVFKSCCSTRETLLHPIQCMRAVA
jgi:hypothetical protein